MKRILLADPDPATRNALALLLGHKLGLTEILEADDVDSLVQQIVHCLPDLLLLDASLLDSAGPDGGATLREMFPSMRLAILSVDDDAMQLAQSLGAAFIHKGSAGEQVLQQMRALVYAEEQ